MANILAAVAGELALFAAVGFFVFALDDLLVDILYLTRRFWRSATIYRRHPRAFADRMAAPAQPGWFAIFVPAWDESAVIGDMLRATLERFGDGDYRIFVGQNRNDEATALEILRVDDARIQPVEIDADGPTSKADCLNHLYDALVAHEWGLDRPAKAIVLHDAEDLVHPLELILFDRLVERAAAVQLPVVPLIHPASRWISGHYCDEFAEAHGKELVVREAVGAAIPLAGVGCAIERGALSKLAAEREGKPFAAESQTEDYELGLRLGALGLKTLFVRIPAVAGEEAVVAFAGHFPSTLDTAVRQKARWIGGIAMAGWDRMGWGGRLGERWMRMRDRRGPLAAFLLLTGYLALFLWSQLWLARAMGAPIDVSINPLLGILLGANLVLLLWRLLMRMMFTARTYGLKEGFLAAPRLIVGNVIAILAAWRAFRLHVSDKPQRWDKTRHIFPGKAMT
ncbi:glycosyl transferase family protein [Sphingomicrobium sp. B8]|uniref:Glycosyl transferase family protein n=1 Tax=Sphingomicrobium clamense TaxID=2851013 RepID=A0ABS6V4D0_9SPHN|nr:glycosyl transferase family protein [Sphingomicrobium sp. B8]MBW0144052.1 glycosyl transferase family protein [Sphingomicrobium sp. B8]